MNIYEEDFNVLIEKVINENVLSLFREAIDCYNSYAFRGSILTLWVAIMIDIITKISHLADTCDNRACKNKITTYQNIIKNNKTNSTAEMMKFENGLLKFGLELQLYSKTEMGILEGIKQLRNNCSHLSLCESIQFQPCPSHIRSQLVYASNILFVRPPVIGKAFIDSMVKQITNSSFPDEVHEAYNLLKSERHLGRATKSCISGLIKSLIYPS